MIMTVAYDGNDDDVRSSKQFARDPRSSCFNGERGSKSEKQEERNKTANAMRSTEGGKAGRKDDGKMGRER